MKNHLNGIGAKGTNLKATVSDMRRNPRKILDAIARNESVTLTDRGVVVARIEPVRGEQRPSAAGHEAFGMWSGRRDMGDVAAWVRRQRKGRFGDH